MFHRVSFLVLFLWVGRLAADTPVTRLEWTNNLLTVTNPSWPGGRIQIWYLEAFLRPGAHEQDWGTTKIPHRTELLPGGDPERQLSFRTVVDPEVEVLHEAKVVSDGVDFSFRITNQGKKASPIQWFQPACIRVADFTGLGQSNFIGRSFIFTAQGLTTLDRTGRTEEARYRGGQVYLPPWTAEVDANPRPVATARLERGLIGCFSADNRWLLATASDRTHELFEGVYVCLHSDPLIGGLAPGETKHSRQRLYIMTNSIPELWKRYQHDFPKSSPQSF